ncbi:MAG: hypothetical protein M1817_000587 [Caeruleum heppii]|nr:MAG: hypothetical protein M1817_000587 [Caeruleum heppii]
MGPPSRPQHSRARTISASAGLRVGTNKRLSLSFPINSTLHVNGQQREQSSCSTVSTTPTTTQLPHVPEQGSASSATDSSGYLVALAAQERRVLELKEELQRAEEDLRKLKRQWSLHEATKKRNELRHVEQLQPLRSSLHSPDGDGAEEPLSSRASFERENAKSRANERKSRRRIITGNGHTRALSLLSPGAADAPLSLSQPSLNATKEPPSDTTKDGQSPTVTGSISLPSELSALSAVNGDGAKIYSGQPKDAILRTGKRMAEDFREGLWTFIDDLRQATVGDEAVHGTGSRGSPSTPSVPQRQSSKTSMRSHGKRSPAALSRSPGPRKPRPATDKETDPLTLIDLGGTFWKEQSTGSSGLAHLGAQTEATHCDDNPSQGPGDDADDVDGWDNWDSPAPKASTPVTRVKDTPPAPSAENTPKSTRSAIVPPSKEEIPWPSLTKLSPGNLSRRASTLMTEWERSLSPSSEGSREGPNPPGRSSSPLKASKDD